MTPRRTFLTMVFGLLLASLYTTSALAFCGTIRASAGGLSDEDALKKANALGLVKVRQLDQQYGGRVTYQPAKHDCKGASHSTCVITQTYCVADGSRPVWPKCGKNEVIAPNDGCKCKPGFDRFMGKCEPKSIAQPWTTQACKSTKLACSQGSQSACRNIESRCNPN